MVIAMCVTLSTELVIYFVARLPHLLGPLNRFDYSMYTKIKRLGRACGSIIEVPPYCVRACGTAPYVSIEYTHPTKAAIVSMFMMVWPIKSFVFDIFVSLLSPKILLLQQKATLV